MAEQKTVHEEGGFVHIEDQKLKEESLKQEIQKYKDKHSALLEDIGKLDEKKDESEALAQKYRNKADRMEKQILKDTQDLYEKEQKFEECVTSMHEENQQLRTQAQDIEERNVYLEQEIKKLKDIFTSGMERKMVFKGKVSNNVPKNGLSVKHRIRYPVNGGTALITFEKPSVADTIIAQKYHTIDIEGCRIHVKAEPVELLLLDSLGMDMNVSSRKILVSNLPGSMSEDSLLDKLELFFTKGKNGGGEVDVREYLSDSKSVIFTFVNEGVAPRLVEKKYCDVPFGDVMHQVHISPSLNGNLKNYEMKNVVCDRTVLITGIPDILDTDNLQDLLEIHFQKSTNNGGEVQSLLYCPEGKHAVALFEEDNDDLPHTK